VLGTARSTDPTSTRTRIDNDTSDPALTDVAHQSQSQGKKRDPHYFSNHFSQQNVNNISKNVRNMSMGDNNQRHQPKSTSTSASTSTSTSTSTSLTSITGVSPMPLLSMPPPTPVREKTRNFHSKEDVLQREERQKFLVFIFVLFKFINDACKVPLQEGASTEPASESGSTTVSAPATSTRTKTVTKNNRSSSILDESSTSSGVSAAKRRSVSPTSNLKVKIGGGSKNEQVKQNAKRIVKECIIGCRLGMKEYQPLIDVVQAKLQTIDGIGVYWERAKSQLDSFWLRRKREKVVILNEGHQQRDGLRQTQNDNELLVGGLRETHHGKGKEFRRLSGGDKSNSFTAFNNCEDNNIDGVTNEQCQHQKNKKGVANDDDDETYIVSI